MPICEMARRTGGRRACGGRRRRALPPSAGGHTPRELFDPKTRALIFVHGLFIILE